MAYVWNSQNQHPDLWQSMLDRPELCQMTKSLIILEKSETRNLQVRGNGNMAELLEFHSCLNAMINLEELKVKTKVYESIRFLRGITFGPKLRKISFRALHLYYDQQIEHPDLTVRFLLAYIHQTTELTY